MNDFALWQPVNKMAPDIDKDDYYIILVPSI